MEPGKLEFKTLFQEMDKRFLEQEELLCNCQELGFSESL